MDFHGFCSQMVLKFCTKKENMLEEIVPMIPPENGGDKIPRWVIRLAVGILIVMAGAVAYGVYVGRI